MLKVALCTVVRSYGRTTNFFGLMGYYFFVLLLGYAGAPPLSLTNWYLVGGTSLAKKSNQPNESKSNVHFNTYLVKTVFPKLSFIRVSFLMETDFRHRFQPCRCSIWRKEGTPRPLRHHWAVSFQTKEGERDKCSKRVLPSSDDGRP